MKKLFVLRSHILLIIKNIVIFSNEKWVKITNEKQV